MSRATPITDDQLFALLREIDPVAAGSSPSSAESNLVDVDRNHLLTRILASERGSTSSPSWRRRDRRWLAVRAASGAGAAVAAVVAVVLLSAGNAPTAALAGWSAEPTESASGQVQAAESECKRNSALASLTPTLLDTRGPYTLLVYAERGGSVCITGPSLQSPTREPPVASFGSFLAQSLATEQRARARAGAPRNTQTPSLSGSIAPDSISTTSMGGITATVVGAPTTLSMRVGRVGVNVAAVTLVLKDGSRVQATTSRGWFAAWWPGGESAQTAEIKTASGSTTQQLVPPRGYESSAPAGR
jgi:hypothetical protein